MLILVFSLYLKLVGQPPVRRITEFSIVSAKFVKAMSELALLGTQRTF